MEMCVRALRSHHILEEVQICVSLLINGFFFLWMQGGATCMSGGTWPPKF